MTRRARSRFIFVALVMISGLIALIDLRWLDTYRYPIESPDFYVYYLAARVGAINGWASIYDPAVFLPLERAAFGRPLPYLNPPELAWMIVPLSWLPYTIASWIWRSILLAAAAATCSLVAPGRLMNKVLHGLGTTLLLPVFISVAFGQATLLVVAIVAIAWWLIKRDRPWLAGTTLALLILKPQVAFLVPLSLLLAGYGRVFFAWLAGTVVLALSAVIAVGPSSLGHIAQSLRLVHDLPGPVQLSLLHYLPLPLALLAMGAVLIVGAAVVIRFARRDHALAIAVGLMTSVLVSPYINFYDLSAIALAAWLLLRLQPRSWYRAALLSGYLPLYLAPVWPLSAVGAVAIALVLLLAPWRREQGTAQLDRQPGAAAA